MVNHQFPLNGDRKIQEILRQQAPRPPSPSDVSLWKTLTCVCGSVEFAQEQVTVIKYNPFAPREMAPMNLARGKCASCGKYPSPVDGEWKFLDDPSPVPQ